MLNFPSSVFSHAAQGSLSPLFEIKNIIAIGSGKGGVGKSTVAFYLAKTLVEKGYQVGLVDSDIYGPSLPVLTGIAERAFVRNDKKFQPHFHQGLYFLSIGHLVEESAAMIWRGPMACGALLQLFHSVAWPSLDYLIVDLPPGTGDLLLTLCQKIPLTGVLLVTHPHKLAYADYVRAQAMFMKMGIYDLGVVLNHFEDHTFCYNNVVTTLPYSVKIRHAFEGAVDIPDLIQQKFEEIAFHCVSHIGKRPLSKKIPLKVLGGAPQV